jgi:hypothetical protein
MQKQWHKFSINRFVGNFLQPTYKNDACPLSMWEVHVFFINTYKKNL